MEKVTRYRANDGQLFINSYDCELYERNIVAMEKLETIFHRRNAEIGLGSTFAKFVLENKEEIVNILIDNMKTVYNNEL